MTEGEEIERKEKLKTKWAQLEAIVGASESRSSRRTSTHYETRLEALEGKAMIVCMSRRICVDLVGSWCACARTGTSAGPSV